MRVWGGVCIFHAQSERGGSILWGGKSLKLLLVVIDNMIYHNLYISHEFVLSKMNLVEIWLPVNTNCKEN